ncbi:MAG TPA: hypothetical protein VF668_23920 [Pyrinomonadaceae bacterium]
MRIIQGVSPSKIKTEGFSTKPERFSLAAQSLSRAILKPARPDLKLSAEILKPASAKVSFSPASLKLTSAKVSL